MIATNPASIADGARSQTHIGCQSSVTSSKQASSAKIKISQPMKSDNFNDKLRS
jgi:hypothetical protein